MAFATYSQISRILHKAKCYLFPLVLLCLISLAADLPALAQPATLIKDINTLPEGRCEPTGFIPLKGRTFFLDYHAPREQGLWETDGTPEGTRLIHAFPDNGYTPPTFSESYYPRDIARIGDRLYFGASASSSTCALWTSDGTESGTHPLETVAPLSGTPYAFSFLPGSICFFAQDGSGAFSLWTIRADDDATTRVRTFFSRVQYPTIFDDRLYFIEGGRLWCSDSTSSGTTPISAIPSPFGVGELALSSATLYITAQELWKIPAGTTEPVLVKQIGTDTSAAHPRHLTDVNGTLYFAASKDQQNWDLWKTNGTEEGTQLLPNNEAFTPSYASLRYTANFNGRLLFAVYNFDGPYRLWQSDGTASGTILLYEGYTSFADTTLRTQKGAPFNGYFYFSAAELWRTDGTPEGTAQFLDLLPGPFPSTPTSFCSDGSFLYFEADSPNGTTLWRSDGSAAGTILLRSLYQKPSSSCPVEFQKSDSEFCFIARQNPYGYGLWTSDGTPEGTRKEIGSFWYMGDLLISNHIRYFCATNPPETPSQYGLYASDGTESGTRLIISRAGGRLFDLNGKVIFLQNYPQKGLWKTDGTTSGTSLLKSFQETGFFPEKYIAVGGKLFFHASETTSSLMLWVSDGTTEGTHLVESEDPLTPHFPAVNFSKFSDSVCFFSGPYQGRLSSLWRSDGTKSGTKIIKEIDHHVKWPYMEATQHCLFFSAWDSEHGEELWKSDGTPEGTVLVKDIHPGTGNSALGIITTAGNLIFFTAHSADSPNKEIWRSDGTNEGTFRLFNDLTRNEELYHSFLNARPVASTGKVVFPVQHSILYDLWVSDGTDEGTFPIQQFLISGNPYVMDNWYPTEFCILGQKVLFTAATPETGAELFALPLSALTVTATHQWDLYR